MEPQGVSRPGKRVLAKLMASQIYTLPAGSLALWGEHLQQKELLLSAFLFGRKLFSRFHLHARHCISFLYDTGAFQAMTLVLGFRGIEFE